MTTLSRLTDAWLVSPVTVPVAAPAATAAVTVPEELIPVTEIVYVVPLPLTADASGPPAVLPARLTSELSNPATGSLNVTVNRIGPALVGSAWVAAWLTNTTGGWNSAAPMSTPLP